MIESKTISVFTRKTGILFFFLIYYLKKKKKLFGSVILSNAASNTRDVCDLYKIFANQTKKPQMKEFNKKMF